MLFPFFWSCTQFNTLHGNDTSQKNGAPSRKMLKRSSTVRHGLRDLERSKARIANRLGSQHTAIVNALLRFATRRDVSACNVVCTAWRRSIAERARRLVTRANIANVPANTRNLRASGTCA